MFKLDMDNENKLIFMWMTEKDADTEDFIEIKKIISKSKKYKLITFISGTEDVKKGLKKLILENAK
jgi:hypothetical protein